MRKIITLFALLTFLVSQSAFAQRTISGRVISSEDGIGMPGVPVVVKGTTIGTATDVNGNFTLNVPNDATIVVSFIGFRTQELVVGNQTSFNITLQPDAIALGDVVVTALGISRERKTLTYAVTEVAGENLAQVKVTNLGNALSGKIAGVDAASTATGAGGSSRVIIRGNNSLSGSNQPLYVVNGVPINTDNRGTPGTYGGRDMGDGLMSINPDDIQSISVLKGGSAAALYGSRAANGVILITTKSGVAQKGLGVELNSTYTIETPVTTPNWQYEYGSGSRGNAPTSKADAIANGRISWGAKLDGSDVINPDGVARPYVAQKNNIKNFYNTGTTFSNTLSFNGGTDVANFRLSVSDMDNASIVPNSTIKRNIFNLSVNGKLSNKLIIEARSQYNIENAKNRTSIADFTQNPNASIGLMATNIDVRTLAPGYDENDYEVQWSDYIFVANPYFVVNKVKNEDERRRFIGSLNVRYNFTDFLYARARVGIDHNLFKTINITPTGQMSNRFGNMSSGQSSGYETNAEVMLGFNKEIGPISLNAIVGGNQMYRTSSSRSLSSGDFNVPFQYFIANGKTQTFSDSFSEQQINSLFVSGDVGFNNYLFLNFTGRQDWFSTLSPESNNLFYPSVGISFLLSEVWNSKPEWLSYGKIRSSWAQVGGGAPGAYGLVKTYSAGSQTFEGQQLMTISGSTIPNALEPFTSTTMEAGIEIRVLNDRIGLDFTMYDKKTTKDIVSASVSLASSFSSVRLNVGEMQNRGIELLLTGSPLRSANSLNWDIGLNMAYNENTLLEIAQGIESLQGGQPRTQNAFVNHYKGKPYGMVAGYKMRTDDNGNIIYNSANGIPMQSPLMALGRGVPPFVMGLRNDFNYKNFSLGFLIEGKFGSVIYSSTNAYGTWYGKDRRTVENGVRENGVSVSGKNQNGENYSNVITAQNYYQGIGFTITDEFVYDASFIKLREVSLGYNVPALFNQRVFQSAYISLVARNPFIIYRKTKDIDPESSYSVDGSSYGLENFGVLPTRSIGINLSVKF